MDLEQRLRESYDERLGGLDVPAGDVRAARRAGQRMRARRHLVAVGAAATVVAVAVAGAVDSRGGHSIQPSTPIGHWRELPAAPLSPRADALIAWTGHQVLVLGGNRNPCPPGADCIASQNLRDGAAYDPATDRWHRVAPAPVAVGAGDYLLAAGGRVLLGALHFGRATWYVYEPDQNSWRQIPAFLGDQASAVGDRVYGLAHGRVREYDARRGVWDERIPRDPILPRLTQRVVTATPAGPVISGLDSTQPNDGRTPSVALVDLWDGHAWHRLPPTGQLGTAWAWTGSQLVDPDPTTVDGGEIDPYPHAYPQGGLLDPVTGRWTALPKALSTDVDDGWGVSASGGRWVATYGQVYDTRTGRTGLLPRPDGAPDQDVAAVWTDRALVVFGGVDSSQGYGVGALTDRAWLWTP